MNEDFYYFASRYKGIIELFEWKKADCNSIYQYCWSRVNEVGNVYSLAEFKMKLAILGISEKDIDMTSL